MNLQVWLDEDPYTAASRLRARLPDLSEPLAAADGDGPGLRPSPGASNHRGSKDQRKDSPNHGFWKAPGLGPTGPECRILMCMCSSTQGSAKDLDFFGGLVLGGGCGLCNVGHSMFSTSEIWRSPESHGVDTRLVPHGTARHVSTGGYEAPSVKLPLNCSLHRVGRSSHLEDP